MPFTIVRQDITKMKVDAIVNAANTDLAMGGGVCGAIFHAAGALELQAACESKAPISTGGAAITPGFALPAKYIIHAAGPVYRHWDAKKSEELLRSAYTESLRLARENGCESIAFPLISSGIYGYPKDEALRVAQTAIRDFLVENDMDVYLAVFDKAAFAVSSELLGAVESYIDENYIKEHHYSRRQLLAIEKDYLDAAAEPDALQAPSKAEKPKKLADAIGNMDAPFNDALFQLIDAKGMTDKEVRMRANIDHKLLSKIRIGKGYMPSKKTALALAIALKLTLDETNDLLGRAGYTLSHSKMFDVIIEYFIQEGKYDIFEINEVLFRYDQPLLGSV